MQRELLNELEEHRRTLSPNQPPHKRSSIALAATSSFLRLRSPVLQAMQVKQTKALEEQHLANAEALEVQHTEQMQTLKAAHVEEIKAMRVQFTQDLRFEDIAAREKEVSQLPGMGEVVGCLK